MKAVQWSSNFYRPFLIPDKSVEAFKVQIESNDIVKYQYQLFNYGVNLYLCRWLGKFLFSVQVLCICICCSVYFNYRKNFELNAGFLVVLYKIHSF